MKLTEEQLRRAAKLAQQKDLARLPEADTILVSPRMEQKMQTLITQVKRGEITPARASMGWRYYTRNGIAAVLIGFLLTCAAMPEVVIAGCQRLIQMVETVFEEYTQQEYTSNASAESTFVPVSFGYMPEGMVATRHEKTRSTLYVLYIKEDYYFILEQRLLTEDGSITYGVDTEDADVEQLAVNGETVQFIYKENWKLSISNILTTFHRWALFFPSP